MEKNLHFLKLTNVAACRVLAVLKCSVFFFFFFLIVRNVMENSRVSFYFWPFVGAFVIFAHKAGKLNLSAV